MPVYKRILLKLSGESLMGAQKYGLDTAVLNSYATQIKAVVDSGVQVGIVIGGGNIFRGLSGVKKGFDRVKGDQMGMLCDGNQFTGFTNRTGRRRSQSQSTDLDPHGTDRRALLESQSIGTDGRWLRGDYRRRYG